MSTKGRRFLFVLAAVLIMFSAALAPPAAMKTEAAGQISKRLAQVKKDFPQGSRINRWITVPSITLENGFPTIREWDTGGCNALVAYATMKIYHNPYVPGTKSYKKVGTAKTSSTGAIKKLFKKAKKGDVVRWHKGGQEFHFAIYLSKDGSGIKVYEANFGPKNKVWYNHKWPYGKMKAWTHGATQVRVYRSKNFSKVDKGKAAKNLAKGSTFTHKGITYKVTKAGIRNAQVKVIAKSSSAGKVPKAIGLNYDNIDSLLKSPDLDDEDIAEMIAEEYRIRTYSKKKGWYYDEQYFTVKQ